MSKEETFERLRNYFQGIANSLAADKLASTVFSHKGDAGESRETKLEKFLHAHLPKRCEVIRGGFIFDSEGNKSRQIDLIITNDLTLQFKHEEKSFNCIEGCYCAISVKTKLDKKELIDSLDNIASIPPMPKLSVSPILKAHIAEELPFGMIFAYEGIDKDTISKHIQDHYSQYDVPLNRRPNMIIVNNEYAIFYTGSKRDVTRDGAQIPPHTYVPMTSKYIGAYSLVSLLTQIQLAANIGSHILMDFGKYIDKIPVE